MTVYKYRIKLDQGYAYIALLIIISMLSLATLASAQVNSLLQKRMAEEELLFIGQEFQSALISYANATPNGSSRHPNSIEDLLKDNRTTMIRRHLRKLYVDPITKKEQWGFKYSPDGKGIIGIYSLSNDKPIKIANFPSSLKSFENQTSYRYWVFGQ